MPAIYIPGTDRIIFTNPHTGDLVIDLKNYPELDNAISQEDVHVVGDWTDYTGSGTIHNANLQGISDVDPTTTFGQLINTEVNITDRGNKASTSRQRSKLVYIENNCENKTI